MWVLFLLLVENGLNGYHLGRLGREPTPSFRRVRAGKTRTGRVFPSLLGVGPSTVLDGDPRRGVEFRRRL